MATAAVDANRETSRWTTKARTGRTSSIPLVMLAATRREGETGTETNGRTRAGGRQLSGQRFAASSNPGEEVEVTKKEDSNDEKQGKPKRQSVRIWPATCSEDTISTVLAPIKVR